MTTEKRTEDYTPYPEASEAEMSEWLRSRLRDRRRAGNPLEGYPSSYGKPLRDCRKGELLAMRRTCREYAGTAERKFDLLDKMVRSRPI